MNAAEKRRRKDSPALRRNEFIMDNGKIMAYKKILIINLAGIGDILLSIPALRALRRKYPAAKIYLLTTEKVSEIVKDLPYPDRVFLFRINYGGTIPFMAMIKNGIILMRLRKERFDLALNMRTLVSAAGANKIKLLLRLIRPRITMGRDTDGRGDFFDIRVPETQPGMKYEMEYDLDAVRMLGAAADDTAVDFKIDDKCRDKIALLLRRQGISGSSPIIGIHPGGMPSRRWPLSGFLNVIEAVSEKIPCVFVVTGGKDEVPLADTLKRNGRGKVISLAGRLSVGELGALMQRCRVFISNDTGPMHIAAILKTPLVALFGPGDITRFDPRNIFKSAVVFYEKKDCAPCEKVVCDDLRCMKAISPQAVTQAVMRLILPAGQ